jgi:hypothetical protein
MPRDLLADLEAEMLRRGMIFDVIDWSDDLFSAQRSATQQIQMITAAAIKHGKHCLVSNLPRRHPLKGDELATARQRDPSQANRPGRTSYTRRTGAGRYSRDLIWRRPAWSTSRPFAISSNFLIAASKLANGHSSLNFVGLSLPPR